MSAALDKIFVFKPDQALKNKIGIGKSARQIFTDELVESCQQLIDSFKDGFFEEAIFDLYEIENDFIQLDLPRETLSGTIHKIAVLRVRSEVMGFTLLTRLLQSFEDYCEQHYSHHDYDGIIVDKHLQALRIVMEEKIRDAGGNTGQELMDNIYLLITKLRPESI